MLLARMNADLHMAEDLKATDNGNPFVVFGEPDVRLLRPEGTARPDAGRAAAATPPRRAAAAWTSSTRGRAR